MPDSPDIHEVAIDTLGGLGDGIGRLNDKPIFVPKSCPGDRLSVRIVHQNHDGYQGLITGILSPGLERTAPPCPHFTACGGCTLQQLQPDYYRAFKTRILHSALASAGFPMPEAQVHFLAPASRRRVEFKVTAEGTLGLLPLRSHIPVPIATCLILEPRLQALIEPLNAWLKTIKSRNIKSIALTAADRGIDMLLTLTSPSPLVGEGGVGGNYPHGNVLQHPPLPNPPPQGGREITRVTARLPDGSLHTLQQSAPVEMQLGAYNIPLPPDAFLQATAQGQQLLTDFALTATDSAAAILDLFCGIGTYSFPLSAHAKVHAVEMDANMVQNLKRHALPSLTAEQRDLFKNPLKPAELNRFQAAIINPPRVGAKAQTEQLAQSNLHTIAMISCNPATFARDAKILKTAGFTLETAQAIDQFVWSPHLEIAARFTR